MSNKGFWNAETWVDDTMEWQQSVIRNTDPINFESAQRAIGKLYEVMKEKTPPTSNWFIAESPLVAGAVYFYLLGKGDLVDGMVNFRNRHLQVMRKLEKLPKERMKSIVPLLTVANLAAAWGDGVVCESVKVPHKGGGRSIFNDMGFGKKGDPSFPDEHSMQTRSMDFAVPYMVNNRDILASGRYEVIGQRTVDVPGFGGISHENQQEMYQDNGNWQFIGNAFFHIWRNGYKNEWVDMFLQLYTSCGGWIATREYVILVDRPQAVFLDGINGMRHNPNGPAISWDGYNQYFLQDRPVPPRWIEEGIQYQEVMDEQNGEIRNMMLRQYGFHNYIRDSNAELIDEDVYNNLPYELYRTFSPRGEVIHLLKCRDASHMQFNPDTGKIERKIYAIPVSNQAMTCQAARADLANTTEGQYKLVYET